MTPNPDRFETYTSNNEGQVLFENNKACRVIGCGTIRIKMFDGQERILQGVRHVPELKRNLISLGMLDLNGYTYREEGGVIKVLKGSLVIMKGVKENDLYTLPGSSTIGVVEVVSTNDSNMTKLWHRRVTHISKKGLLEL